MWYNIFNYLVKYIMGKPRNPTVLLYKKEIQEHIDKYHSLTKASRDFNIPKRTLGNYFKTQWDAQKDTQCLYEKDRTTLNVIDTQNKAYVLGLLIADGSISCKGCIKIEVKDKELCNYVKQVFKSEAPVIKRTRVRSQFKNPNQTSYVFCVVSVEFVKPASQWGLIPAKTHSETLCIPNIPNNLKPHFLRGYFDGDGSIFDYKYGQMVGFTGNKSMMYSVKEYLNSLGIACKPNVKQDGSTGSWKFYFGAKKDVKAFNELIYKDSSMYLQRKKDKFKL